MLNRIQFKEKYSKYFYEKYGKCTYKILDHEYHKYVEYENRKQSSAYKHQILLRKYITKEKYKSILTIQGEIRTKYKVMESAKRSRLLNLSLTMWNSILNEFYMTADITDNTIWRWQDELSRFEEYGYLYTDKVTEELTTWTLDIVVWIHNHFERMDSLLSLLKDFNLDNQPSSLTEHFQKDFMEVDDDQKFCSALLKWTDLVYWHPEKQSLYDYTIPAPSNSHYEDDFNEDYGEEGVNYYEDQEENDYNVEVTHD